MVGRRAHDRGVVLIDENHRALPVVREEQAGKEEQGVGRQLVLSVASGDAGEERPFLLRERGALGEVAVPQVLAHDVLLDGATPLVPGLGLGVVEGEVDDRIGAVVLAECPGVLVPDSHGCEDVVLGRFGGGIGRRHLEIAVQHAQVEGLAEPARPAEERGLRAAAEEVGDKQRLVDDDGVAHGRSEIAVSQRERSAARQIEDANVSHAENAVAVETVFSDAHSCSLGFRLLPPIIRQGAWATGPRHSYRKRYIYRAEECPGAF